MTFGWLMKHFKKQKWRIRSNLNRYESKKNIRNYVGKCKSSTKEKREGFHGRIKNISAKNNSTPTKSTPAFNQGKLAQQQRTNSLNVLAKYYKNYYEVERPKVTGKNLSIMEKKPSGEATISLSNSSKKGKRVSIFAWISLFFLQHNSK